MAVQETVDITINSSQAIASLRNIESNLNTLTNGFRDFMGGVVEGMTSALRETTRASAGVDRMRKSFDNLGTSVGKTNIAKKLGTEVGVASKNLVELDRRATDATKKLLGLESIVGALAFTQVIRGAAEYARETQGFSEASFNAVRAQESLGQTLRNFQQALLNVLNPISQLVASIQIGVSAFESLLKALTAALAAFLAFKVIGLITKLMGGLFNILTNTTAAMYGIGKALGEAYKGLLRFIGLGGAGKIGGLAGKLFTLTGVFAALLRFALRFAGIAGIIYGAAQALDFLSQVLFKFSPLDALSKKFGGFIDKLKEFIGLQKQQQGPMGRIYSPDDVKRMEEDINMRAQARLEANKQSQDDLRNIARVNRNTLEQLRLQNRVFGRGEDYAELQRTILELEQRRRGVIEQIQDRMADPMMDPGVREILRQQIESYQKLQSAADAAAITELKALQNKRAQLDAFNKQMEYTTEMYNQQIQRTQTLASILQGVRGDTAGVLFEREQLGRGPVQQQIAAAYDSARRSALEAQRQFAETFGDADGLTPERMAELVAGLDAIAAAFKNLAYQTENNILISQQWSTGWNEAFNTFVDNALNAADRAREVFNGMVSSMENALDNFVRTGKLNFRDLVNSMIADLMSAALRQAFRNLLMMSGGGGGGWLSTLGSFFAGFFANGGFIPPGKAGIVGERGPELISGPAQVTPLSGAMAPVNNYYTYNINALDAKSVAQLFSENRRTLLGVTEQARKEMPIRQRF